MQRFDDGRAPGREDGVADILNDGSFVFENTLCRLPKVGGKNFRYLRRVEVLRNRGEALEVGEDNGNVDYLTSWLQIEIGVRDLVRHLRRQIESEGAPQFLSAPRLKKVLRADRPSQT